MSHRPNIGLSLLTTTLTVVGLWACEEGSSQRSSDSESISSSDGSGAGSGSDTGGNDSIGGTSDGGSNDGAGGSAQGSGGAAGAGSVDETKDPRCPGATADDPGYPKNVLWTGPTEQSNLSAPLLGQTITDAGFGNVTSRVTEDGVYHHYAKTQPYNSDGTLFMSAQGGSNIRDTSTLEVLDLKNVPYQEPRWSSLDRNKIYYLEGAAIRAYNLQSDDSLLVHDFSARGCDLIRLGPWEGNYSIDDKMVALACQKDKDLDVLLYNIETDTLIANRLFSGMWGDEFFDWVSVSQSGKNVVINWRGTKGVVSYDTDLKVVSLLSQNGEHGDLCIDEQGNDVYVQVICGGDAERPDAGIMAYRLDTGEQTVILPPDDFICTGHISCRNSLRPGWAYVSATAHKEVFAVKLDGSSTVEHFAHTHSSALAPLAVPDRTGCSVMWASDWSGSDAAYVTVP